MISINILEIIERLFISIIMGGLIGYEREFKNRPAGFRTHILVCVGAAVISMIELSTVQQISNMILQNQQLSSFIKVDIGRMGAQVITGIGFLGAGTIIHEKGSVKGLTTAASIWVVACIGLAIGLGYYTLSILSAVSVFIVLVMLKKFEVRFIDKGYLINLEIIFKDKEKAMSDLSECFQRNNITIKDIEFEEDEKFSTTTTIYSILYPRYIKMDEVISELRLDDEILKISKV